MSDNTANTVPDVKNDAFFRAANEFLSTEETGVALFHGYSDITPARRVVRAIFPTDCIYVVRIYDIVEHVCGNRIAFTVRTVKDLDSGETLYLERKGKYSIRSDKSIIEEFSPLENSTPKILSWPFFVFVETIIKNYPGKELYRIYDVSPKGGFVFLLRSQVERNASYTVFLMIEPKRAASGNNLEADSPIITSFDTRELAERYIHQRRHELKGLTGSIECAEKCLLIRNIKLSSNMFTEKWEPFFEGALCERRRSKFDQFVKNSIEKSFHGHILDSKTGKTHAGQYFSIVVSKLDYYIVRVVLEPDERWNESDDAKIDWYSRTVRFPNTIDDLEIYFWVSQYSTYLTDKIGNDALNDWVINSYVLKFSGDLLDLQNNLKRGDHIRRDLRVGTLALTTHDGIYLGDGKVAHYTTDSTVKLLRSKEGSGADIVSLKKFMKGEHTLYLVLYRSPERTAYKIADFAEKSVSADIWNGTYNLANKNCQLFALSCVSQKFFFDFNMPFQLSMQKFIVTVVVAVIHFPWLYGGPFLITLLSELLYSYPKPIAIVISVLFCGFFLLLGLEHYRFNSSTEALRRRILFELSKNRGDNTFYQRVKDYGILVDEVMDPWLKELANKDAKFT